jgi:competence protein ComEC
LSSAAAALASGFLIGEIGDVPTEIHEWFRASGTMHLLAVSGSNVALVVIFMIVVLRPFGLTRQVRAVVLLASTIFFCWLSYAEPSVVRASLMASLVIMAQVLQRRYDLNHVIAVAAMAILLIAPTHLFSVGFQLSFATAWGLILVVPWFYSSLSGIARRAWQRWLLVPLVVAIVAQLYSLPLTAYYFHRVSLISTLANLVIVPAVSIAVIGSLVLLGVDLLTPLAAPTVGAALNWWLDLVVALLRLFGGDATVLDVPRLSAWAMVAIYTLLILGSLSLRYRRLRFWAVSGTLGFVFTWLGLVMLSPLWTDSGHDLHFVSVPGGVAAIVQKTGSHAADLVIVGTEDRKYDLFETILEPQLAALGIRRLRAIRIIGADYGTLEELLIGARERNVDTVLLSLPYRAAVHDVTWRLDWCTDHPVIDYMASNESPPSGSSGWCLDFPQAVVCFGECDSDAGVGSTVSDRFRCLVMPTCAESGPINGGDQPNIVICAKTGQFEGARSGDDRPRTAGSMASDRYILELTGALLLNIPADSTTLPELRPDW